MERRDYLELMTGQIRCRKMCPVIAREVEDHIEDQKQAFMAEGMTEEEAEKAAVEEMGDPVEVGVEMDQIHRPKMPWKAILVIALMEILSGIFPDYLSGFCDGRNGGTFLHFYADAGVGKGMVSGCGQKSDGRARDTDSRNSGGDISILFLLWCGISENAYPGDVCAG